MTPAKYNIDLHKDGTFSRELTYKDDAGAVVDLSSHTATLVIRKPYGGGVILSLSDGSGIVLDDVAPNLSFEITDEQTNAMDFTTAVYTLTIIDASGHKYPLMEGRVSLHEEDEL